MLFNSNVITTHCYPHPDDIVVRPTPVIMMSLFFSLLPQGYNV